MMFDRLQKGICLGSVFVLMCAALVEAAFLRNVPVHVKQPDGTVLSCLASGDEYYNWLHDKDGYTILRNPATGFLVYADKVDGKLVSTEFIAGRTDVRALEQAGVKARLLDDPQTREMRVAAAADEPIVNVPQKGTINNLVVYIRFSDQEEFAQAFIDMTAVSLNSTDSGVSSFRNYFTEVSYNQLTVGSTCYPGATPGVFSYQDSYARAYYMPYDATTNPGGYNGDSERATREHTLLQNAVNAISAEVPVGLDIDADLDDYVDNICFVVRGEPTAWATLLWPHKWQLHSYAVYIKGKRVWVYNLQMETTLGVGVLCHEMFHSLGSPDLYHYNSAYKYLQPVWAWDLMEWNLDPPEHMGAYMKWKYGTWIASIPEITTSGTYTLHPLTSATNNCYKIASPVSSTEYFIVEYRKKTGGGTFEGNLYNEGLLVYRINTGYMGNANGPPDEVYIYRPSGSPTVDGEPWYAPLSANQDRTQINDGTNPSSFLTDGSPGGLAISNVGLYGDTISFDVAINTLTVTSPNGGEAWTAGDTPTVTWMSTGSMSTVDIQLSTDSGTSWTTLADNTSNDGSETITVPAVSSGNCLIKVAEGTFGAPFDLSDANFSIALPPSPITVISPNGGETWVAGSIRNITWTQSGLTGSVTFDLYKGGIILKTLGTAGVSDGTFSWAIGADETAGSDYRIRISQGSAWDESDADFTLILPAALPFTEDFTAPPSNWHQQNIGSGIGSLWSFSATNYAGGSSYELRCSWSSINPGTTRLITPPLNTTGFSILRLRFKHFLDAYGTGCVLKIQTSSDGSVWTDEAWSVATTSSDIGPQTVVTDLAHNLNIATTYVGFVITGNLYQYDFWYVDDISVSSYSPKVDFNKDGQEDILWRYYGTGGIEGWNVAWLMTQGGTLLPEALGATRPEAAKLDVLTGAPQIKSYASPLDTGKRLSTGPTRPLKAPMGIGKASTSRPEKVMRSAVGPRFARSSKVKGRVLAPALEVLARPQASVKTSAASTGSMEITALGSSETVFLPTVQDTLWELAGTGDFDRNGNTDTLWRYYGAGALQGLNIIWYMNGTAIDHYGYLPTVQDTDWRIEGTGDFNGDGTLEILWRYYGTGGFQGWDIIWYLTGETISSYAYPAAVTDLNWKVAAIGDFNGDKKADLLWRYSGTGDFQGLNVIWYMNGAEILDYGYPPQVTDLNWKVDGAGDFDADTKADLLWRYYGTDALQGWTVIWYMNDAAIKAQETLTTVQDINWRIVNR